MLLSRLSLTDSFFATYNNCLTFVNTKKCIIYCYDHACSTMIISLGCVGTTIAIWYGHD